IVSLIPGVRVGYWEDVADNLPVMIAFVGVFVVLYSALLVCVGRRRNWARWTVLISNVLGSGLTAIDPAGLLAEGQIAVAIELVEFVLEVWACYLLFFGAGRRWFRAR